MTATTIQTNTLRFVLFEEDGAWVAVCLERYIGSQGRTMEEAERALQCAYRAELDHSMKRSGIPFHGIMRAPDRFFEMWDAGGPEIVRKVIYDQHGHKEGLPVAA